MLKRLFLFFFLFMGVSFLSRASFTESDKLAGIEKQKSNLFEMKKEIKRLVDFAEDNLTHQDEYYTWNSWKNRWASWGKFSKREREYAKLLTKLERKKNSLRHHIFWLKINYTANSVSKANDINRGFLELLKDPILASVKKN